MVAKKYIAPDVKASEEVEKLLKQVKWKLGDAEHIRIRDDYGKLRKLLSLQASSDARKKTLERLNAKASAADKEIATKESGLLWLLKKVVEGQGQLSTYPPSFPQNGAPSNTNSDGTDTAKLEGDTGGVPQG